MEIHMSMTRSLLAAIATASALAFTSLASAAEHVHAGDIIVTVQGGKLIIDSGEAQAGSGYKIFEGGFGPAPLSGNRWRTDDPGYDMEPGTLATGDQLWVRGLGQLKSWNGSAWAASVSGNEFIRLEDSLEASWVFRPTGLSATLPGSTGVIDEAGLDGHIHQHLDFYLINSIDDSTSSGSPVATGAYLIQLQLFSPTTAAGGGLKYLDSDPFFVAFNRGLDEDAFEHAVQALAVPEPSAALMILSALGLIAWRMRRRSEQ